jgi:deoxycytidylate deaminase
MKAKRFFELARRISYKSPSRYKLGAIIVQKNRIISVGWNDMKKSSPNNLTYGGYQHAELRALLGLDYRETRGAICYVYRETLNGELAKSRPCEVCWESLKLSGIKEVWYTSNEGFKKEIIR